MMEYIVHNLFSTESGVFWLVLKWILVVLAAGFIGQFGKAFATYLMRRVKKTEKPEVSSPTPESPEALRPAIRESSFPAQPAVAPPPSPKDEKKEKKALAKRQKKILKKLFR